MDGLVEKEDENPERKGVLLVVVAVTQSNGI
jgi:hypothetical protein